MKNKKGLIVIGVIFFLALVKLFIYKINNIPKKVSQPYEEMFI